MGTEAAGESGAFVRLAAFFGVLCVLLIIEIASPLRERRALPRLKRWPGALSLMVLGTLAMRLVAPLGLVGWALWLEAEGFGGFALIERQFGIEQTSGQQGQAQQGDGREAFLLGWWLFKLSICVLLLDLAIWAQHVASHHVGWLWRLHRVHHADPDMDVSTALRFHPLESLLSLGWKVVVVAILGAPAVAVLLFEILLNAAAMFNHANIRMPGWLERILGIVVITPRQHRVHHAMGNPEPAHRMRADVMQNYGFSINLWDRLAGCFRAEPTGGITSARYGLMHWRDAAEQSPLALLRQPFEGEAQTAAKASAARTKASTMPSSRLE